MRALHTTHSYSHILPTASEAGNFLACSGFMCADLSQAIKINLIFTTIGLHCCLLTTSPRHLLQPLALTFSPARKTPAASYTFARPLPSSPPPSLLLYLFIYSDLSFDSIFIGSVCVSPPCALALEFPLSLLWSETIPSAPELLLPNCVFSSWMIDWSDLSNSWKKEMIFEFLFPTTGTQTWAFIMGFHADVNLYISVIFNLLW